MTPSTLQATQRHASQRHGSIVVELGTRQLPARMRLGRLRGSIGMPLPRVHGLRRMLMAPVTMMLRVASR